MTSTSFAIIPVAFFIALVTVFIVLVLGVVAVIRAFVRRDEPRRLSQEEDAQLRRIMESLQKMEARIVNLETILLERGATTWERTKDKG